jgi:uncharacterized membrane protein
MTLLFCFLIGLFAGLRSLTPPAAAAWAVHVGWLRLERPLALIGSAPSVAILTLLAVVELVADKLPAMPSRKSPAGLITRMATGGLTGGCVAVGGGLGLLPGVVLGACGGIAGGFVGYSARTGLVRALGSQDIYVAVLEDLAAVGGSVWVVSRF